MTTLCIILCEHVEEEGFYIIIQGLVVEEELGQKAEVLAVDRADLSIHLEKGLNKSVKLAFL